MDEKKMQRMQRAQKTAAGKTAAFSLTALVLALSFIFLVSEKKDFSEQENRYLEPFPVLSWEAVKSGSYMENLNAYLCDHFPFRDEFLKGKTAAELLMGRKEINGVFIGDGGYLIEPYEKPENTERIGGILKSFAEKVGAGSLHDAEILPGEEQGEEGAGTVNLMLVPTACTVYADRLPAHAPAGSQMAEAEKLYELSGMEPVDCSGILLEHQGEDGLYYRTDHHWTTYGAYLGYVSFCEAKGLEAVPLEAWEQETVTEAFHGTIDSKVHDIRQKGDAITIYRHPEDRLTVTYEDTGEVSDSLYNLDYVNQKDKYSLFLNNLHPLITVVNETAETDRELALIKDSYANSMVPFLAHHYKKIHIFDTRYYKLGPSSYIAEHPAITDVLVLYNMNTLDGDLGVRGIY